MVSGTYQSAVNIFHFNFEHWFAQDRLTKFSIKEKELRRIKVKKGQRYPSSL